MIRVHLKANYSDQELDLLGRLTGGEFQFTMGDFDKASDCSIIVGGRITADMLDMCPGIKHVVIPWAGIPEVTAETLAQRQGITLHNLHHNAVSAAEMAVTLMLAAAKVIIPADRALRNGDWRPRYKADGLLVEDSRILVLGWGSIGERIGRICSSMGAQVKGIRSRPQKGFHTLDELENLLPETDILMVSVPLTSATRGVIGEEQLNLLPRGAVLVNISRGPVVQEEALFRSLSQKHLGAAGLDVWYNYPTSEETRSSTSPSKFDFGKLDNVVMSPHRGGSFGLPGLERRRFEHLANLLLALAHGQVHTGRVSLEKGY